MLKIDGAHYEGGGQIVRTAVALSALSGTPVEIDRIRGKRKNPGMGPQHCAAIRAVAETCGAGVSGNVPGSRNLTFIPGSPQEADIAVDVGTAGSVTLVIQAWLPVAIEQGGSLEVRGGTEVPRSPTIDYLAKVFLPALGIMGKGVVIDVPARGYYPHGGGHVKVRVEKRSPCTVTLGCNNDAGILSCSSGLPGHVADRQASAAASLIRDGTGRNFPVSISRSAGPGIGSSCTVWDGWKGASALGRRGLPAEDVGLAAARELVADLTRTGEADQFLSDQLLVYLGRYGGSYSSGTFTMHARTVVWILGMFGLPVSVVQSSDGVIFQG